MTWIYTENPISFRCPNRHCNADVDEPCRTVGGFVSASPHTPRLRLALEHRSRGDHDESMRYSSAAARYLVDVLRQLLGRDPSDDVIARARKDGSLKLDRGWLCDEIASRAPVVRAQPTRRVGPRKDEITLWGKITREELLPGGGFLLRLHTGEVVHMPADFWGTVWPERKAYRVELEREHPELRGGWWCFVSNRGQCTAAAEEPDRVEAARASAPAVEAPGQMSLL